MIGSRTSRDQDNLHDKDRVTHRRQGLIDRQTDRQTDTHNTHTHTCTQPNTKRKIETTRITQTHTDTIRHNQTNRSRQRTYNIEGTTDTWTHTHTHTHSAYAFKATLANVCNGTLEGHPLTSIEHTHRHISTANPAPQVCTSPFQTKQQTKHPIADVKVAWLLKRIPLSEPTEIRQCWLLCTGQAAGLKQHTHQPNRKFHQNATPRLIPTMVESPRETCKCTNRSRLCTHDGLQGFVCHRWKGCVHPSSHQTQEKYISKLDKGKRNHAQIRSVLKKIVRI